MSGSGETAESRVLLRDGSFEADIPIHQTASKFGVSSAIVAQCNPHVAPFCAHLNGRPGRPSGGRARTGGGRGGFVRGAREVPLKEDMRKQLRTLQALRLDWRLLGCDWSHTWLQPQDPIVAGVTPTIDPSLSDCCDLVGSLAHPGVLRRMVRTMERSTWGASALMSTHTRVEKALAAALAAVGEGGGEGGGGGGGAPAAAPTADGRAAPPRATPQRSPTRQPTRAEAAAAAAGAAKRELLRHPSRSPARRA